MSITSSTAAALISQSRQWFGTYLVLGSVGDSFSVYSTVAHCSGRSINKSSVCQYCQLPFNQFEFAICKSASRRPRFRLGYPNLPAGCSSGVSLPPPPSSSHIRASYSVGFAAASWDSLTGPSLPSFLPSSPPPPPVCAPGINSFDVAFIPVFILGLPGRGPPPSPTTLIENVSECVPLHYRPSVPHLQPLPHTIRLRQPRCWLWLPD